MFAPDIKAFVLLCITSYGGACRGPGRRFCPKKAGNSRYRTDFLPCPRRRVSDSSRLTKMHSPGGRIKVCMQERENLPGHSTGHSDMGKKACHVPSTPHRPLQSGIRAWVAALASLFVARPPGAFAGSVATQTGFCPFPSRHLHGFSSFDPPFFVHSTVIGPGLVRGV